MKVREKWLDIAKGLIIILVVLGHSMPNTEINVSRIISWFHMPAFFMLIGYLFKPVSSIPELKKTLIKRGRQLLVPYSSFLILITGFRYLILWVNNQFSLQLFIGDVGKLIAGGRNLTGVYGVFWFVTCLFFSYLLLLVLFLIIKSFREQLIVVIIFYFLAHLEALLATLYTINVPWNIDVALLSSTYMVIGYWLKTYMARIQWKETIVHSTISAGLIFGFYNGLFDYYFDMKNLRYHHILLDLFIPLTITFAFFGLSHLLKNSEIGTIFADIGKYSLPIMYLHLPLTFYLGKYIGNSTMFVLIGVLVPWLLSRIVFERSTSMQYLFLGNSKNMAFAEIKII